MNLSKKQLKAQLDELEQDYQAVVRSYNQKCDELLNSVTAKAVAVTTTQRPSYAASLSFDLWPPGDWLRLCIKRYRPGRYFQIYVGPIRFDFYEG